MFCFSVEEPVGNGKKTGTASASTTDDDDDDGMPDIKILCSPFDK